jgi:uncharacterized membrane protein YgcG
MAACLPRAGILGALATLWPVPAALAQPRIYVAPDDHTDFIWAATEAQYEQYFVDMLDCHVARMDRDIAANVDTRLQNRFTADGSYWLWVYEKSHTQAQVNHLGDRIKSGHLTVNMAPLQTPLLDTVAGTDNTISATVAGQQLSTYLATLGSSVTVSSSGGGGSTGAAGGSVATGGASTGGGGGLSARGGSSAPAGGGPEAASAIRSSGCGCQIPGKSHGCLGGLACATALLVVVRKRSRHRSIS